MEVTWWWLLTVPVFFGLGWLASRLDASQWLTETRQLPASYFAGLNHLLNERPEQAISAFEEVARLDPDTAELYFALGNLFRRRGETERAIRIHRNLLERADLPESLRELALFNLAQDYLNAGIFDRAESAFTALAQTSFDASAKRELARLYEKESNWLAALDSLQAYLSHIQQPQAVHNKALVTLPTASTSGYSSAEKQPESSTSKHDSLSTDIASAKQDLSHYACELATSEILAQNYQAASKYVALAADSDPNNPRATVCSVQLLWAKGEHEQAIAMLDTAVLNNVKLVPIAVQTLVQLSKPNPSEIVLEKLLKWVSLKPQADSIGLMLPLFSAEAQDAQRLAITNMLVSNLKQVPYSLAAVASVLGAADQYPEHTQAWRASAQAALLALVGRYDKPSCSACGFKATRHHWRCPSCGRWNTLPYTAEP